MNINCFGCKMLVLIVLFAIILKVLSVDADCSVNCLPPPNGTLSCNETTEECLYGCHEGFVGSLCNVECPRNCTNCTLKYDNSTSETKCVECQEGFYQNKGNCDSCSGNCLQNDSSSRPVCREADGVCEFGCIDGYYNHTCNTGCSSTCKDKACDRLSGKCTHGNTRTTLTGDRCADSCNQGKCTRGCNKNTLTGDRCVYGCNQGCVHRECEQDGQCIQGCYANYWGTTCREPCNENCAKVSDPETNPCDEGDGHCVFGCTDDKWWGEKCTLSCSVHCKGGLCQNASGSCINGCETNTMFGSDCSKTCSLNCQNGTCLVANGVCIGGCIPGWFGETCDKTCPENCVDNLCFVENGTCSGSCKSGYFDQTCSSQCSDQCANRTCYVGNGECVYGCNRGYNGSNCSELPSASQSENNTWIYVVTGCCATVAIGILVAAICIARKRCRDTLYESTISPNLNEHVYLHVVTQSCTGGENAVTNMASTCSEEDKEEEQMRARDTAEQLEFDEQKETMMRQMEKLKKEAVYKGRAAQREKEMREMTAELDRLKRGSSHIVPPSEIGSDILDTKKVYVNLQMNA